MWAFMHWECQSQFCYATPRIDAVTKTRKKIAEARNMTSIVSGMTYLGKLQCAAHGSNCTRLCYVGHRCARPQSNWRHFTPTQIEEGFSTSDIAALLTTAQISQGLTLDQVAGLTNAQLAALTTTQVSQGLTPAQLAVLTPAQTALLHLPPLS